MKGRYLHNNNGKDTTEDYDLYGSCINSVDRKLVNEILLTACEKLPNVELNFNASVKRVDFNMNQVLIIKYLL